MSTQYVSTTYTVRRRTSQAKVRKYDFRRISNCTSYSIPRTLYGLQFTYSVRRTSYVHCIQVVQCTAYTVRGDRE